MHVLVKNLFTKFSDFRAVGSYTYTERLKVCKLPTLHFRHIRGDMIQMYKLLSGKYDPVLTPQLTRT